MNYSGTAVSEGVAIGTVYLYQRARPQIEAYSAGTPAEEAAAYDAASLAARAELETLRERLLSAGDQEKADIFGAHLELLTDEVMDGEIREAIREEGLSAPQAVERVFTAYAALLSQMDDPLIREREMDLRDVCGRLLRGLAGEAEEPSLSRLPGPVILVAEDLLPSDTAALDREHVLGIVTEVGGSTSHTAIIARSHEIPAVLGVREICRLLHTGQEIILDAVEGTIRTEWSEEERASYEKKRRQVLRRQARAKQYLACTPVTRDGVRIEVELNIASADPKELEPARYTDGVGLFRSEFLYMGRDQLPDEEEQFQAYRRVLLAYGDRPVVLRTMDIGGDKPLECLELPKEDNPFLGNRALRLCFQRPELFHTQLRAALRASVFGNLWLMFPMVASIEDIRRAKEALRKAREELGAQGIPYAPGMKVGIMVEIPSIALLADKAAQEVDFASIGTNDLVQYTTAVDRGNPEVRQYYQTFHPAVFRLIGMVVRAFSQQGKPVGVCGEMGGNPLTAAVLLGLGIRRLSMGAASLAPIKELVCAIDCEQAREIAETVCACSTAQEAEEYLRGWFDHLICQEE